MDPVRKRIARAIKERGLSYKEVSLQIGRNHAYLQQFIERGVPQKLNEELRGKISELLGIPEFELGAPTGKPIVDHHVGDIPQFNIHAGMGNGGAISVMVDQNGHAIDPSDSDGFWSFPDSVKAGMGNLRGLYAMPCTGDSMEPTLPGGSYAFVDTNHRSPSPPDLYAVDYGDGLMIKRIELIHRT